MTLKFEIPYGMKNFRKISKTMQRLLHDCEN